jgi:hypothetical protein
MKHLKTFALAGTMALAIATMVALCAYATGLWAGGHKPILGLVLKLNVGLAVLVGLVCIALPVRKLHGKPVVAAAIGVGIGCVYWYLAPRVLFWYSMGRWPGFSGHLSLDFDVEAVACWTSAGLSAALIATGNRGRGAVISIILLALAAVLLPGPVFNYATRNEELTVAFVVPQDGASVEPEPENVTSIGSSTPINSKLVSEQVLQLIARSSITGKYHISRLYRTGKGKPALAVIVVREPISVTAHLAQPNRTAVVYVQEHGAWVKIPSQAGTLDRDIEVSPAPGTQTGVMVEFTISDATGYTTTGVILRSDTESRR